MLCCTAERIGVAISHLAHVTDLCKGADADLLGALAAGRALVPRGLEVAQQVGDRLILLCQLLRQIAHAHQRRHLHARGGVQLFLKRRQLALQLSRVRARLLQVVRQRTLLQADARLVLL